MTVIPGTARIMARSSLPWWLARNGVVIPGRKAAITAVWCPVESAIWTWSLARRVAKTQYVTATGKKPVLARPPAMPIMFCSAMPTWKKRSGNACGERGDVGVLRQVGGNDDQLGALVAELNQGRCEGRVDKGGSRNGAASR